MQNTQTAAYLRGRAVEGTRHLRADGTTDFVQSSIPNERSAFVTHWTADIEVGERVAVAMERADLARARA